MLGRRAAVLLMGALLGLQTTARGVGQTPQSIVGTYCLAGVREVGSCFRFAEDQTFEYFLSYGAYDEGAEGRWRLDGNEIVLESPPYDRQPRFVFKETRETDADTFKVIVVTAAGHGLAGIDVRARCDGRVHEGYTQQDGLVTPCSSMPSEIALGVRMVGLAHQVVPVSRATNGQKALVFEFEPGDLGKKPFAGTRLRREDDALSMTYRSSAVRDLDGRQFSYRRN